MATSTSSHSQLKLSPQVFSSVSHFNHFIEQERGFGVDVASSEQASTRFYEPDSNIYQAEQVHAPVVSIEALQRQFPDKDVSRFVLLGQTLSWALISKIVTTHLANTHAVYMCKHPLHQTFQRQALVVMVVHEKQDSIDKSLLLAISTHYYLDVFSVSDISLSTPGLLIMDMDSTIIDMECIDEIALLAGVGEKVAELTERAMQGELDFNQSLNARVGCLRGIAVHELEQLKSRLPVNPGFAQTISLLKSHGWIVGIASGGFTYFADYLQKTYELDFALSNTLAIEGNKLSGAVLGNIVNAQMKQHILQEQLHLHQINPQQSIAIGDGANDLLMMSEAALGVAYKAKPKVKIAADANIQFCGFEGLLYCLSA